MWYIRYKDTHDNIQTVPQIFNYKNEAYTQLKEYLNKDKYKHLEILNIDTEFALPDLQVGSKLYFNNINNGDIYGEVIEIHDYLVCIDKSNSNNIVELTKSRLNKEYIKGNLIIKEKD